MTQENNYIKVSDVEKLKEIYNKDNKYSIEFIKLQQLPTHNPIQEVLEHIEWKLKHGDIKRWNGWGYMKQELEELRDFIIKK